MNYKYNQLLTWYKKLLNVLTVDNLNSICSQHNKKTFTIDNITCNHPYF